MSISCFLAPYCSLNPTLRNGGIINKTGGPAGSKVRYYCKPGYRMIGHNNATCRRYQNGMYQWDSPVPICHGKIMLSSWVGSVISLWGHFTDQRCSIVNTAVCKERHWCHELIQTHTDLCISYVQSWRVKNYSCSLIQTKWKIFFQYFFL